MSWHQIPFLLRSLGYERAKKIDEQSLLISISSSSCDVDIQQLITEVHDAIYRRKIDNWQPALPENFIEQIKAEIQQNQIEIQKNLAIKNSRIPTNLCTESIKLCRLLVVQDPLNHIENLVLIAQNLSWIGCHADAVSIALESLSYVKVQEQRSKLNFVLAIAYDQVARETLRDYHRLQAVSYYQSAMEQEQSLQCIASFKVFELDLLFAQKKFLRNSSAHLSLNQFVESFAESSANFYRHKAEIRSKIQQLRHKTQDPILLGYYDTILGW